MACGKKLLVAWCHFARDKIRDGYKYGGPNLTLSCMLSLFLSPMQAEVLFAKSKQAFPKLCCRQQSG